jgi:Cu+-exporting ATPase
MAEAGISIALAKSTDEALAASDLVAIHGDIDRLDEVFSAGKKLASVVKQNYLWAFSFNSLFIPIAALGKLVPLAAMLLMLTSSIAVLLNSLRLR